MHNIHTQHTHTNLHTPTHTPPVLRHVLEVTQLCDTEGRDVSVVMVTVRACVSRITSRGLPAVPIIRGVHFKGQ